MKILIAILFIILCFFEALNASTIVELKENKISTSISNKEKETRKKRATKTLKSKKKIIF